MAKIIYLDQNKWIDLARAEYNQTGGEKFKDILKILKEKVEKNEIIFPMSIIHFIETARSVNGGRKERLAKFMVMLSNGYGIIPFNTIREVETQNAVLSKLGLPPDDSYRKSIVGKGIEYIVGASLQINGLEVNEQKELKSKLSEDDVLVQLICDAMDGKSSMAMQNEDKEILAELERIRKRTQEELSKEKRLRLAIVEMSRNLNSTIVEKLHSLKQNIEEFTNMFKDLEDWKSFFLGIPTIDIWINLHLLRDNDIARKIDRNDTNDIAFLSIAVPYCDIVVTEKYWEHMLNSSKLSTKHSTIVLTSLLDLEKEL